TREGYEVESVGDGAAALAAARTYTPDVLILDLMLPGMDGFEVTRALRKDNNVPILMLTARDDEIDRVLGLEMGADDYLTKPFSMRELAARVRAVLRRLDKGGGVGPSALLRAGDLTLDRDRREVTVGQASVDLTPSEFDLLATFLSAPGRVFSRLELLDKLQGDAYEGYERTIDVHIRNLRAKIESDPRNPRYIVTVYGIGYRLAAEPVPV
ncbi:MAG TPA: response regulator transcription factor, partial [Promineifilum sp.]|nr:response regulator transcription factor [Promineifilum sp.]